MRTSLLLSTVCAMAAAVVVVAPGMAWADCGSVPFYAPTSIDDKLELIDYGIENAARALHSKQNSRNLQFDPLSISVFEPKQRAIILWNGEEEILLLSTDQRATQRTAVLEVIPLPAEPKVRLGSFETFEAAKRLAVEKRMWACAHGGARAELLKTPEPAGRISFHQKMGAHELAVAEVLDQDRFSAFVQNYLKERFKTPNAPIRPEFLKIIDNYAKDGFRWFAFDVIALDDKVNRSRQPIEYRFKSDAVFYPLKISALEEGETEVDLLVFASGPTTSFEGLERKRFAIESPIDVKRAEVEKLDKAWAGFFGKANALTMNEWKLEGKSADFLADVVVK